MVEDEEGEVEVPEELPALRLTSPSGESWEYGNPDSDQVIRGMAHEFAQVVTQTRNIADTRLECDGEVAQFWMRNAQCFAGAPAEPPAPGLRRTKVPS